MRTRIPLTSCSEPLLFVIRQNLLHNPFIQCFSQRPLPFSLLFPYVQSPVMDFRYLRSNRHDNTLIASTLIIFYSNYCSFQRKNSSTDLLLFSFPVQNLSGRFESS